MMPYDNQDRRWMEDQFRHISEKLSEVDRFMGEMKENREHRRSTDATISDRIDDIQEELAETNRKVDGLLSKINKWEAKLGSFMFIAGCLWAFFVAMKDHLLAFVKG